MSRPLVLPYDEILPDLSGPYGHAGPLSAVLGRVCMGARAWLGARSVIRADGHHVRIGDDFRLGHGGTVHIAHDVLPTRIGDHVRVGPGSVVHACDVGDRCHLGAGVVVLDGARVEAGAALADGAVVFPRREVAGGWLHAGMPAEPVRRLDEGELEEMHRLSRAQGDEPVAASPPPARPEGAIFVAATAWLNGPVACGGDVGIWFGCVLDAGGHRIVVGEASNVQDNAVLRCGDGEGPIEIGRTCTIGHNATLGACRVGDRSLVGIGAIVAPGTEIGEDVLLAAGAATERGQLLESGHLYGGRPARKLGPLDADKRRMIAATTPTYVDYARRFQAAQEAAFAA